MIKILATANTYQTMELKSILSAATTVVLSMVTRIFFYVNGVNTEYCSNNSNDSHHNNNVYPQIGDVYSRHDEQCNVVFNKTYDRKSYVDASTLLLKIYTTGFLSSMAVICPLTAAPPHDDVSDNLFLTVTNNMLVPVTTRTFLNDNCDNILHNDVRLWMK